MNGLIKIIKKQTNVRSLENIYNQAEKENITEIKKAVLQRLEELGIKKGVNINEGK
jgi:hypothetical protein